MTTELNGLVFTTYKVRCQWKVSHCVRNRGRISRAIVVNVDSPEAGEKYAIQYADTH